MAAGDVGTQGSSGSNIFAMATAPVEKQHNSFFLLAHGPYFLLNYLEQQQQQQCLVK